MTTVFKPKRSVVPSSIPTAGQLEVGEIALNIPDGKFYTKDTSNVIKEVGGAGATTLQGVTNVGAVTTNNIVLNGSNLVFEGIVENAFETSLTVEEPTSDRTITLPNITGTVITTGNLSNITSLGVQTAGITFEGSSDDAYETTLAITDPTADRTITLPNIDGTVITTGNLSSITSVGALSGLSLAQNGNIIFEGSTDDAFETTVTVINPTADRTITLPDQSGVLATEGDSLAYAIVFGS
jgi:hypothetical protein